MPREELAELERTGPYTVDYAGRMLWTSLDHAMTYAQVRALVNRTRQEVVPVRHLGVTVWHVRRKRALRDEPTC